MRKVRTSKIIMWLFILLLFYVIYKGVNYDFSQVSFMDGTIFCACVAAVSGIVGAIVTKYYNNSNAENIPRIQTALYKDTMNIRLEYNREMMKLQKEYGITSDELCNVDNSNLSEISENILNNAINELDNKSTQSHEDVDIQNYL